MNAPWVCHLTHCRCALNIRSIIYKYPLFPCFDWLVLLESFNLLVKPNIAPCCIQTLIFDMSFSLSYKATQVNSPPLYYHSTATPYATSGQKSAYKGRTSSKEPPRGSKSRSHLRVPERNVARTTAHAYKRPKSIRTLSSRKSSVYDALSLIDTYMCDASILDYPIDVNPFDPIPDLPDINIDDYRSKNTPVVADEEYRKSVISKVFSEEELLQLGNIFTDILEEGPSKTCGSPLSGKWNEECPTKVNGSPADLETVKAKINNNAIYQNFVPNDETPVNSDDEDDDNIDNYTINGSGFRIPIGIDNSPVLSKQLYRHSLLSINETEELQNKNTKDSQNNTTDDSFDFSKIIDRHFSSLPGADLQQPPTKSISTKSSSHSIKTDSKILKSIRKIRNKLEFSNEEIVMIRDSWALIFEVNQQSDFSSLHGGSHKSLFKEKSTHNKDDNICAYSFTKQFYNNLFRQMSFIKQFFPNSTTKRQIVAFGNILTESSNNLQDLNSIKKFLYKNCYLNQDKGTESCGKTIFGYNSIKIQENEVYFSIFGKIFLRTLNENYPKEFHSELEEAWSKFYLFLFSCIVGGLNLAEMAIVSSRKRKNKRIDSSITVSIDDESIPSPSIPESHIFRGISEIVDEQIEEENEIDRLMNTSIVTTSTVENIVSPPTLETPLSVAAYRTSPASPPDVTLSTMNDSLANITHLNEATSLKKPTSKPKMRFALKSSSKSSSETLRHLFDYDLANGDTKGSFFHKVHNKFSKSPVFQHVDPKDYVTNGKKIERKINQNHLNNSDYYNHPVSNRLSLDDIRLLNKLKMVKDLLSQSKLFKKYSHRSGGAFANGINISSPSNFVDYGSPASGCYPSPASTAVPIASMKSNSMNGLSTSSSTYSDGEPLTPQVSANDIPKKNKSPLAFSTPVKTAASSPMSRVPRSTPKINLKGLLSNNKHSSPTSPPLAAANDSANDFSDDSVYLSNNTPKKSLYTHENCSLALVGSTLDAPVFEESLSNEIFNHQQLKPLFINGTFA